MDRPPRLPDLVHATDPVLCRIRTLTVAVTVVVVAALVALVLGGGRPVYGWSFLLVAFVALPVLRTGLLTTLTALGFVLVVMALSSPGLSGWTSLMVFVLHLATTAWFLAQSVPAGSLLHRSAVLTVARRFGWIQAVAQIAVLVAILTADLPDDTAVAALGLVVVVGLAVAVAIIGRPTRPVR